MNNAAQAGQSTSNGTTSVVRLTKDQIPNQIDLAISLHLHLWPALSLAIQNAWGTSSPQISADKRDWLAGAVSDLFAQNGLRDTEDLEDVLEQVMFDEFELVVDDGSLEEVAAAIWRDVSKVRTGDGSEVKRLLVVWEEKQKKGGRVEGFTPKGGNVSDGSDDDEDDAEWTGFADTTQNGNTDVDMDEAPQLIDSTPKSKPEPEIDEDGFTKVVSKKKR